MQDSSLTEPCGKLTVDCQAVMEQCREHVRQMIKKTHQIRSLTETSRQVITKSLSEASRFRNC